MLITTFEKKKIENIWEKALLPWEGFESAPRRQTSIVYNYWDTILLILILSEITRGISFKFLCLDMSAKRYHNLNVIYALVKTQGKHI